MTKLRKTIASHLEQAREERGLSQTELAKLTGLLPSAISHFETGRRMPSVANLLRLADALGASIDALFGRDVRTPTGTPSAANQRFAKGRKRSQTGGK